MKQRAVVAAILCIATLLVVASSWNNYFTVDEPYHILAGLTYLEEGRCDLNPEHPPLVKYLAAAPLAFLPLSYPAIPPVQRIRYLHAMEKSLFVENTFSPRLLLRLARLPLLLFFLLLLTLAYYWSRRLYGPRGALITLLLLASQPLLLGHALIVQTDVASAALWTGAFYALYRLHERITPGRTLVLGLVVGLALLAKFSALLLLPLLLLTALIIVFNRDLASMVYCGLKILAVGGALLAGCLLFVAGYLPAVRHQTVGLERATIHTYLTRFTEGHDRGAALENLASRSIPLTHALLGLSYVEMTNRMGQGMTYFLGRVKKGTFLLYFPVGFLLKSSFPFLILLALALARRRITREEFAFLLLPALFYLFVAMGAGYNIGIRHLMPLYPLLAIFAGRLAPWSARRGIRLLLWLSALVPFIVFPHYIAHTNLLAGGPWMTHHYLADSNLDWGQEWFRMKNALEKRDIDPVDVTLVETGFTNAVFLLPQAKLFFPRGAVETPYLVLPRNVELVGPALLRARGMRPQATRLEVLIDTLEAKGEVVTRIGNALTLYRRPERGDR